MEIRRRRQPCVADPQALGCLGCGVVDLDDAQTILQIGPAQGERVEPGPDDDIL